MTAKEPSFMRRNKVKKIDKTELEKVSKEMMGILNGRR